MNIAIIEDAESDRRLLLHFLRRYCEENRIETHIETFSSGEAFLEHFVKAAYDIIFIDIYMTGIDGMQTAEKIRETDGDCLLIFSTSSEHYAVKSFRVRAFDYLVKPYNFAQFEEVMTLGDEALLKKSRYIEIKEGRDFVKIALNDILYTDYFNHYIQIHTVTRIVRSYLTFQDFSRQLLLYAQFLCCYRNCIVNLDAVKAMEEKDFVLTTGERVPIARTQRNEIRRRYADYMFNKLEGSV